MLNSRRLLAIALDGGTTNTRARLIRDGRVVATARRGVGVRDNVLTTGPNPLAAAVREAIREVLNSPSAARPELIVAAGMLSSEVGLAPVPHVVAPAGIEELAQNVRVLDLPEVSDEPITIVPGVRTPASPGVDGWATADVMRGEECETLGAWLALPESRGSEVAFVWPGSHTKLVLVDRSGRIARSHTTLAGELTIALARHTLLAASLPGELPDVPEPEALAAGARLVEREGLGRAAFLVRIAALTESLSPHARGSFWVGAVIAEDVGWLSRHPIVATGCPIWVGGRQPQRVLYAEWLSERCSGLVRPLADDVVENASALGALAIAVYARGESFA